MFSLQYVVLDFYFFEHVGPGGGDTLAFAGGGEGT
jgi:hypothetical protein